MSVQMVGQFHLGDFVNKFRHGCLVMKLPDSDAAKIPTILFGTINGAIGVLASLPQEQFKFLERLQVNSVAYILLLRSLGTPGHQQRPALLAAQTWARL